MREWEVIGKKSVVTDGGVGGLVGDWRARGDGADLRVEAGERLSINLVLADDDSQMMVH